MFEPLFHRCGDHRWRGWREDWLAGSGLSEFEWGVLDLHTEEHPACPSTTFPKAPKGLISSWKDSCSPRWKELGMKKGAGPTGTVSEHLWPRDGGSSWENAILVPMERNTGDYQLPTCCSLYPHHSGITAFTHVVCSQDTILSVFPAT